MSQPARPRILLIKPVLPYPPDQGTKVVSFGLIRALRDDFDVTVLARVLSPDDASDARELEKWCSRVVTVQAPNRKSPFHRVFYKGCYQLKSALLRRSLKSLYDCPGAFLRAARRLSREPFDLVIIDYWQLQRMAEVFPKDKCVLMTHDIDLLVNRQITLLERNLMRKLRAVRAWFLEQKEEVRAYRTIGRIWTLTERDKATVDSICGNNCTVEVFPVGIDVDFYAPSGMRRNPGEVLFLGAMGAPFNRDALEHFVLNIYPHLEGLPGLSVTIVGGGLPKGLEFFALRPEVEVVGRVSDVRPYLHRASCMVVPLRYAGGLRIRLLEAMSAGLPAVCSPPAVAGMPFFPDREFLLAGSPEEFAAQIRRVLGDDRLARSLAEAASARVRETYAFESQRGRAVALVRRFAGTP